MQTIFFWAKCSGLIKQKHNSFTIVTVSEKKIFGEKKPPCHPLSTEVALLSFLSWMDITSTGNTMQVKATMGLSKKQNVEENVPISEQIEAEKRLGMSTSVIQNIPPNQPWKYRKNAKDFGMDFKFWILLVWILLKILREISKMQCAQGDLRNSLKFCKEDWEEIAEAKIS